MLTTPRLMQIIGVALVFLSTGFVAPIGWIQVGLVSAALGGYLIGLFQGTDL